MFKTKENHVEFQSVVGDRRFSRSIKIYYVPAGARLLFFIRVNSFFNDATIPAILTYVVIDVSLKT